MKYTIALLALLGLAERTGASAVKLQGSDIWGDSMAGLDSSTYIDDTPKAYKEAEKPKVDVKALLK